MKRLIPSVAFGFALLLLPALAWAQQGTVTGTVTEAESGDPLPGATVQIVGENTGAASSADGQYRITGVPSGEQTLQVSFVGYQEQERTVNVPDGGTVRVNFQLRTSQAQLEEVVVSSYAVEEDVRVTGASESVSEDDTLLFCHETSPFFEDLPIIFGGIPVSPSVSGNCVDPEGPSAFAGKIIHVLWRG